MKPNHLISQITIAEAEAKHMVSDERLGKHPIPFGFMNNQWRELTSKLQPGDELWEFSSGQECWDQLMGCEGIALIRDGKVVASITTRMN